MVRVAGVREIVATRVCQVLAQLGVRHEPHALQQRLRNEHAQHRHSDNHGIGRVRARVRVRVRSR
jgi:hypothetical protein